MANGTSYTTRQDGPWSLWVASEGWTVELWRTVLERIAQQTPSKHPQTALLESGAAPLTYYLKTFYPGTTGGVLKDSFRLSKARRAQQMGVDLTAAGFHAPVAIAAGEKRSRRLIECAFVLTTPVAGVSLIEVLQQSAGASRTIERQEKLAALRQLAREIRRFHDLGFVHGDLLPTNIFVQRRQGEPWQFSFMDNDRTRRYPQALAQLQFKRNLVQLNRMPLPGISLQDRMRFLRAYLGADVAGKRGAALARWLETKTRQRRWECDRVAGGSFRSLMRWDSSPGREVQRG